MSHELECAKWLWSYLSPYSADPPLPNSHENWAKVFEIADRGLVLPRLAIKIAQAAPSAPIEVLDYLDAALEINRLRNTRLRRQLVELVRDLNSKGVVPIVMKGATFLLDENIDVGSRVMFDIDIWTPSTMDQEIAINTLHALGYEMRGADEDYELCQHYPPFFRDSDSARIELHRSMVHPKYSHIVSEDDAAKNTLIRNYRNVHFLVLNNISSLQLSYIQCRSGCEYGMFMMKFLDFITRCELNDIKEIRSTRDFGLLIDEDEIDRSFLTAMKCLTGLPYLGLPSQTFIKKWNASYRQNRFQRFVYFIVKDAFDKKRWARKGLLGALPAIMTRLEKSRRKDLF